MAKTTLTFTSLEVMQILYEHARKNNLIPAGTYDAACMAEKDWKTGFNFNLYLKKVD